VRTFVKYSLALLLLFLAWEAQAACNVSATSVSFVGYDAFSSVPLDSTGSVTVSCDEVPPPDPVISISPSGNSGGFFPRKMRRVSGADMLEYNLFIDPSISRVWGDGTAGTNTVRLKNVHRQKSPVVTTIYGRIPPRQNVRAGAYRDTLTVTIIW